MSNLVLVEQDVLTSLIQTAVKTEIEKQFEKQQTAYADVPDVLTKLETAQLCRVTINTVNNWVERGILRKTKYGRVVRFEKSDVLNLLKSSPKHKRG